MPPRAVDHGAEVGAGRGARPGWNRRFEEERRHIVPRPRVPSGPAWDRTERKPGRRAPAGRKPSRNSGGDTRIAFVDDAGHEALKSRHHAGRCRGPCPPSLFIVATGPGAFAEHLESLWTRPRVRHAIARTPTTADPSGRTPSSWRPSAPMPSVALSGDGTGLVAGSWPGGPRAAVPPGPGRRYDCGWLDSRCTPSPIARSGGIVTSTHRGSGHPARHRLVARGDGRHLRVRANRTCLRRMGSAVSVARWRIRRIAQRRRRAGAGPNCATTGRSPA